MIAILTVWEGDYGTPSIDTDSLIIITYMKLAKISFTIKYGRTPVLFDMPRLYIEDETVSQEYVGFEKIWTYLRLHVCDLDHYAIGRHKSDTYAYSVFVRASLLPGIYVTLWLDKQNYLLVTRKWFRKAALIPFNFLYPYFECNRINNYIKVQYETEEQENYSNITSQAKSFLYDLSIKLGEKEFLLGDWPSTIDAVLYGYLAPLLNVPLPSSELQMYLKEHNNLVKYINRMTKRVFSDQKLEYKYVNKIQAEDDLEDVTTPTRTIVFAAVFAVSAMISFGMSIGVIRIPSSRI